MNHNNNKKLTTNLTSFGFFLRNCTMFRLNSLCEIVVPLTRCSCSDSAWNIQFPEPSLSEILKPLSDAILSYNSADRASLSQVLSASHCICWRFWNNCSSSSKKKHTLLKIIFYLSFHLANTYKDVWCIKHQTEKEISLPVSRLSVSEEHVLRALKGHTCSMHTILYHVHLKKFKKNEIIIY